MPNSKNYDLDIDTSLGGNNASDYVIPSQKAIKNYVDNHSGGGTVDQIYNASSANAQSGVAIAGAKFLQNTAINPGGLTIGDGATSATTTYTTNIGYQSSATDEDNTAIGGYARATGATSGGYGATAIGGFTLASGTASIAIGGQSTASNSGSIAIGSASTSSAINAIQIGQGTNSTASSLQVGSYQLLDTSTGLIPDARISTNIERTSNKVTSISSSSTDTQYPSAKCIYDNYQVKLVSGTSIKTINNTSVLGSGNISISGGHTWSTTRPTGTTSTVSSTNPAVVTTNYVNGTSWYRIYSDKWCEQGGKVTPSGSSATISNVSFLKPFVNTNYFVTANYGNSSTNQYGQCYNLTTNGFTTKSYGGYTNTWMACGYIS